MKILLVDGPPRGDSRVGLSISRALTAQSCSSDVQILSVSEHIIRDEEQAIRNMFNQPYMEVMLKAMRDKRKRLDDMMKCWTYEEETEKAATKRIIKSILKRRKR